MLIRLVHIFCWCQHPLLLSFQCKFCILYRIQTFWSKWVECYLKKKWEQERTFRIDIVLSSKHFDSPWYLLVARSASAACEVSVLLQGYVANISYFVINSRCITLQLDSWSQISLLCLLWYALQSARLFCS